jgi:Family of unknown function (DUF6328)
VTVRESVARAWGPPNDDDEVPTGETDLERCQRNFSELLQELRVAQAGVQILFAFLLTVAFSNRLEDGDAFGRVVYLVALLAAAASSALLTAPVAQHRMLFRLGRKPYLVRSSHRMASAGLMLLMVSMVASVVLAVDAVGSRGLAIIVAVPVAIWFIGLWAALPWFERVRTATKDDGPFGERPFEERERWSTGGATTVEEMRHARRSRVT